MGWTRCQIIFIVSSIFLSLSFVSGALVFRIENPIPYLTAELKTFLVQTATDVQNCCQAVHGAAPLQLDANISAVSQNWANVLASNDQFHHSGNHQYGENLFASSGGGQNIANGGVPIHAWYRESTGYNYSSNSFGNGSAGHFTQMVWKQTQRVGFGVASSQRWTYVVANYSPPGNNGAYVTNVGLPNNGSTNSCFQATELDNLDFETIKVL